MEKLHAALHMHAPDRRFDDVDAPDKTFTPGAFFREAGLTIAACLALALFAQVLVAIVGAS